jgi:type III secretory pathway component EscR
VNEWLKFAEAKNFGLLSLNTAIVFGFMQVNFQNCIVIQKTGLYVFLPCALISFFLSLISLIPIISKIEKNIHEKRWINKICNCIAKEEKKENIHFYDYLKFINETEFETSFLKKVNSTCSFTQFERELVTQILYNSRITWLKYQLFKIGAYFFLTGAILFLIALLIIIFS